MRTIYNHRLVRPNIRLSSYNSATTTQPKFLKSYTFKRQALWPLPYFAVNLLIWRWRNTALWYWYLNATREFQKSCLRLRLLVKIKAAVLIYFDSGQNSIAWRLRTSNFESACFMGCSGYISATTDRGKQG